MAAIAKLPDAEQEAIACNILEEIEAEKSWDARFGNSQDRLAELSRRAGEQVTDGRAMPFDPSNRPPR
jgi:hypothetical protein